MSARRGLTFPALMGDLLAGLTSGLVTLVYSLSFAALIFSGKLSAYFPQGVGIALIGATITAMLVAARSAFPLAIAGPEANSAILIALAAASIAGSLESPDRESSVFPTIWATILLSTLATGLFLYVVGRCRWGRLARYIPYPVIGGFLAGTGWLITRSSFKVMTGMPLSFANLPAMLPGPAAAHWIAGVLVAALLFAVLGRFKHFLVLPGTLLGAMLLGDLVWRFWPGGPPQADAGSWFFKPFSLASVWQSWTPETITRVDWSVVAHQGGTVLALLAIVTLSILLNSTGLELATSRSIDLDHELRVNGLANLVNGALGGLVGYTSINRCLLNQQAGARSRASGVIAGGLCASVLLVGSSFLGYVPKPVLGGLLLYIGSQLLFRWVWKVRPQFARTDYLLILAILVIIATLGFLQGVGAGILIACFLFILNYGRTSSIKYTLSGASFRSRVLRAPAQQRLLEQEGESMLILVLHGFVFFGTANALLEEVVRRLAAPGARPLRHAVFDFRLVSGVDSSAGLSFMKLRQIAKRSGLQLVFTDLDGTIESQLRRAGLLGGADPGFACFADLDHGVEWCEDRILAEGTAARLDDALEGLLGERSLAVELRPYLEPVHLDAGQALFRQGDLCDGLYFLESGRMSAMAGLANGRQVRRGSYTGGTILGELGFYARSTRSASVIADQPSRLHFLPDRAFQRMERESPALASAFHRAVVNLVAQRLRRSEEESRLLLQ